MKQASRPRPSAQHPLRVGYYLHWGLMAAVTVGSLQGLFPADQYWASRLAVAGLIVLVLQLAYVAGRFRIASFELWFLLASWLFMFGQVWLAGLGGGQYLFYPLLLRYDTSALAEAGAFALCFIQALFLGLAASRVAGKAATPDLSAGADQESSLRLATSVGVVLVGFALPFRLYEDFRNVSSAQASGTFLAVNISSGAADDLGKLLVPGLLALMVGARSRPGVMRTCFWAGVGYHVIVMVLSGDRRYAVTALIALGLCYVACVGAKRSKRKWATYVVAGLLLLNILAYVRSIRQGGLLGLDTLIRDAPQQLIVMNPILESLAEFGISLMSVVLAVIYVPDVVPYQFGYSYMGALLTLLPVGWIGDISLQDVSVGDLLAGLDGHAVGASQAGELFANFGWWGLLGGFLFGRLMASVFKKAGNLQSPINTVVYYSLFYILINFVRAAFVEVFRASILVSIPVILLAAVLQRTHSAGLQHKRKGPTGASRVETSA